MLKTRALQSLTALAGLIRWSAVHPRRSIREVTPAARLELSRAPFDGTGDRGRRLGRPGLLPAV